MRIETSVVVNRPIDEVWAFTTDRFNVPRFRRDWLGFRVTSPDPIGVGTTFQGRVVIFGLEIRISGAVIEWDPPRAFAFSLAGAGIQSGSVRQTLEASADGTKVVGVTELEPRPALKFFWWIAGPFLRRISDTANQNLKRLLEASRGSGQST